MSNEKISQMISLTAGELAGEDLFLITDMSAKESKKITTTALLDYIEGTGSFIAQNATSASYILGGGVDGIVSSASYSNNSVSSSWSTYAISALSASYALTASVAISSVSSTTTAQTASYLLYSGFPNGTASFSRTSSFAYTADTASALFYLLGTTYNTASYSITSSYSIISSNSISSSFSNTASLSTTASFSRTSSYSVSSSYASTVVTPAIPKAWATIIGTSSLLNLGANVRTLYNPSVEYGYNIADTVKYLGQIEITSSDASIKPYGSGSALYSWGISFINPMFHTNYMVQSGLGGEHGYEYLGVVSYPRQNKTVNGFTMSLSLFGPTGSAFADTSFISGFIELSWWTFTVYSNP